MGTPLLLGSLRLKQTYLEPAVSFFVPSDPVFSSTKPLEPKIVIYEIVCAHRPHSPGNCHLVEFFDQLCLGGKIMRSSKKGSQANKSHSDRLLTLIY